MSETTDRRGVIAGVLAAARCIQAAEQIDHVAEQIDRALGQGEGEREGATAWAPDGVDGHPCIRVEAYLQAVAERDAALAEVAALRDRVEAELDNAEDQLDWRDQDDEAWVEVAVIRAALGEAAPDQTGDAR